MLTDRWHEIESLYHSVRAQKPEARRTYLERVCASDDSLRREVESLLAHDELAASFLETDQTKALEQTPGPSVSAGARIGPYDIREFLQKGGMGEVYKARDTRLDRTVAVKFLPPAFAADPGALERFQREARAASALNHPRICTVHDIGEYQGRPFFVMEFLEGQSLRDYIEKKMVPVPELLDLAVQICDALAAAHAKGIVHRDVKPANLFVQSSGQAKILDFGLAKLGAEPRSGRAPAIPEISATASLTFTLTRPGTLMGTLAYLSPEQARGEEVDARTDIFSFGLVLYEIATGRPTFRGETSGELIGAILHQTPAKPSELNPAIPGGLERIILKAIEKDRAARYQSAAELLADLEKLRNSLAAAPHTRRWLLVSGGAAAAALAGGIFVPRLPVFQPKRKIRVAVLPLVEPNPDPKQKYFAAGLHGEMISILGRLYPDRLAVIASDSVKKYTGPNRRIDQAKADLNLDYVVDSSLERNGNNVRISAKLVRANDQVTVWSETYDRGLQQILATQSEIAQAVARGIERKLQPNPEVHQALARPLNPEAYEAHLRGNFVKAIELDPYYAPAYVGRAFQLYIPALFGYVQPKPAFDKMLDAALKAVELDNTLAGAHGALAVARLHTQWKWREADASFRRAAQVNPNDSGTLHMFAHFLLWANRAQESAEMCNRALALDPFDAGLIACMGWHSLWAGEYDQAIEQSRRALSFDPKEGMASLVMGWTYEQKGMFQEAISALQKSWQSTPQTASIAHALARSGKREAAGDILKQLQDDATKKYVSAYDIGVIHAGLNENDRALEWLNKAFEEYAGFMPFVYLDPRLKTLRSDARFQQLLRRMGFVNQRA
jgi:eukaryotic-like serine/threonine-protein kinase